MWKDIWHNTNRVESSILINWDAYSFWRLLLSEHENNLYKNFNKTVTKFLCRTAISGWLSLKFISYSFAVSHHGSRRLKWSLMFKSQARSHTISSLITHIDTSRYWIPHCFIDETSLYTMNSLNLCTYTTWEITIVPCGNYVPIYFHQNKPR